MKYFSPSILDGSVTTAKLADNAVTRPKVADAAIAGPELSDLAVITAKIAAQAVKQFKIGTSESSQSGTISGNAVVLVTLSAYSFFPNVIHDGAGDPDQISMHAFAVAGAGDADIPRFALENTQAQSRAYDIDWRHVDA